MFLADNILTPIEGSSSSLALNLNALRSAVTPSRDAIGVCAQYIRNLRGMRPAPGIERAANCEEGCWEEDEPVPHSELLSKIP